MQKGNRNTEKLLHDKVYPNFWRVYTQYTNVNYKVAARECFLPWLDLRPAERLAEGSLGSPWVRRVVGCWCVMLSGDRGSG